MGFFQNTRASIQSIRASITSSGWMPLKWSGMINANDSGAQQPNTSPAVTRDLSRSIAPVQLQRVKQDVRTWRDAIDEAENSWYPHRVKMQRCYLDTILNGHVYACMQRRKNMTLLKKHRMVDKTSRKQDDKWTEFFQVQWFDRYREYEMDSDAFGYNLVSFGDIVDSSFPDLGFIKRFNISPDRLNVTEFIYSISGTPFLQMPWKQWHIWLTSPSDVGVSRVGYGYLYKVAFYEIVARNVLTQNLDTTEVYGSPMRVGKTNKSQDDPERAIFETALAEMGNMGYIVMDANGDEVELMESKSLGNGYKIYESLEARCEKKISKIILGHADALDSTPGKLGAGQDGEESPVAVALRDTNVKDMTRQKNNINTVLIPFLNNLGFMIPDNLEWEYDNDEEEKETRRVEDEDNYKTAEVFSMIKTAGGDADWGYFTKRTGIPVTKTEIPIMGGVGPDGRPLPGNKPGDPGAPKDPNAPPAKPAADPKKDKAKVDPKVKAKLESLYTHRH